MCICLLAEISRMNRKAKEVKAKGKHGAMLENEGWRRSSVSRALACKAWDRRFNSRAMQSPKCRRGSNSNIYNTSVLGWLDLKISQIRLDTRISELSRVGLGPTSLMPETHPPYQGMTPPRKVTHGVRPGADDILKGAAPVA